MILFDTDICIELLRGTKRIIQKRRKYPGSAAVSFMTVAELFYGAEKSEYPERNLDLVEEFLLSVNIIESDMEIMKKFGYIKAELSLSGNVLSDADIFIAAATITKCEKLITGNVNHFKRINNLKTENWVR